MCTIALIGYAHWDGYARQSTGRSTPPPGAFGANEFAAQRAARRDHSSLQQLSRDAIVSAIHKRKGDVLKLIGDGVLAIFPGRGSRPRVRRRTRRRSGCPRVGRSRQRTPPGARLADDRHVSRAPSWRSVLWQHRQQERLDFTVVGPAVIRAHRRPVPVGRPAELMSSAFATSVLRMPSLRFGRPLRSAWGRRPAGHYTLDTRVRARLDAPVDAEHSPIGVH